MKQLGISVPLVTPCTREGEIDKEGLQALAREMLDAGCHSLFVLGSTGRGPWFGRQARVEICRTVANEIGTGIPLFAGCMASGVGEMIENAHALAKAGAQIAVVTVPGYFRYSQPEAEQILLTFIEKSPLPVMLYDIPTFAGIKLDLNVLLKLAQHENVIGLKDSSGDTKRFEKFARQLDFKKDFYLMQGKEDQIIKALQCGASGFVASLVQIEPRPFVALYNAFRQGNTAQALVLQQQIAGLLELVNDCYKRRPESSTLFHLLNAVLASRGVCRNILLKHEGDCPIWLQDCAYRAVDLCKAQVIAS